MKKQTIIVHQHHISTFLTCRFRFNLEENWGVEPRVRKKYLDLGSAFHLGIFKYKQGFSTEESLLASNSYYENLEPETQTEADQLIIGKATVTAMLIGYFNKYQIMPQMVAIEKPISIKFGKFKLIGTPDSIEKDETGVHWIGEEKTTSRLEEDYVKRLPLDFQVSFYFFLSQKFYRKKFAGVNYRITRTPTIRLKKKQTLEQYVKEIANEYVENPDWYFVSEKLYRNPNDMKIFESHLEMKLKDLMRCYNEKNWYPNERICTLTNCWFIPYCSDRREETLITYTKEKEDKSKCFGIMNGLI